MYFVGPNLGQKIMNQIIWNARKPIMQVLAPAASPHFSPIDAENRFPVIPETNNRMLYLDSPK